MKVVKRVSLIKGIERLNDPAPAGFRMTRISWNLNNPYRLNTEQELFRFGYRNFKHRTWLVLGGIFALILGTMTDSADKVLADVLLDVERMSMLLFIGTGSRRGSTRHFGCQSKCLAVGFLTSWLLKMCTLSTRYQWCHLRLLCWIRRRR